ncbi:MAG: clostripain-related cysteine peptidase [Candidatus Hermodarchaeota archaeon]
MDKQNILFGLTVLSLVLTFFITTVIDYPVFDTFKEGSEITQELQPVLEKKTPITATKNTEIDVRSDDKRLIHCSLDTKPDSVTSPVVKSWTYMLYLDADNDIEQDALQDFEELEQSGGTNEDINVIVLFDRVPGFAASHGNWTGSRIYQVTGDVSSTTIDSILLEDLGEVNMGDPETLSNFLDYCFQYYPAEKYCLDLWDHGWGGYGLCPDDTSIYAGNRSGLTLNHLQTAITNTTTTHSTYLSVISMDACDMSTLEVAWELRDLCDYFIASEGSVYEEAYNYSAIIQELRENPTITPQALCEFMVKDYRDYYRYTETYTSLSVINQSKIKQILPVFNNFVNEMISALSTSNYYCFLFALARQHTQFFLLGDWIDLIDFIKNVKRLIDLETIHLAGDELIAVLNQVIVYNWQHWLYDGAANGLSIFLPNNSEVLSNYVNQVGMCSNFEGMDWLEDSDWDDFIDLYLQRQLYIRPSTLPLNLGNQTQDYILAQNAAQVFNFSLIAMIGFYEIKSTIATRDVDIQVMRYNNMNNFGFIGGSYLINPVDGTTETCRFILTSGRYYVFVHGRASTSTYSLEVNMYEPLNLTCNEPLTASGGTPEGDGNGHFRQDLAHYFQIELPTGNHSIVLRNSATTNYQLQIYNAYSYSPVLISQPPGFGNTTPIVYNNTRDQWELIRIEVLGLEGVGNFTIEVITTSNCTKPGTTEIDSVSGFEMLGLTLGLIIVGIIISSKRRKIK